MRISELLTAIASWLESPHNEALMLSEYDEPSLNLVAEVNTRAAALFKQAAVDIEKVEPEAESVITPESIQSLADIATAFDESMDPELRKQASVIDELLMRISAAPLVREKRAEAQKEMDELRAKYQDTKKKSDEYHRVPEVKKAIEKSDMTKEYKIMEAPLSARTCPDHPGAQIARVGDHQWQCELDKKVYDFTNGFTLLNGGKVPGSDVSEQTHGEHHDYSSLFDTRETRMQNR